MARFEASYYPGEVDERLPEWHVVEWDYINHETGAKSGNIVWKSYDMEFGERDASDMAHWLQECYNWEVANEV